MQIPLFHVNAFTDRPFAGNPAAVCLLDRWLDDGLLRGVAAENNFSATGFLVPAGQGYELRWFTPRCEVKLCGHATLASALVGLGKLHAGTTTIRFTTRHSGILTVLREDDAFALNFPGLIAQLCASSPPELARALGLAVSPVQVLEVNSKYIAVYESEDSIRDIRPDFRLLEELHPFAVVATAPGKEADFVSRYFAPSYGVPEDAVTGSAHCALAPYWSKKMGKTSLHARQLSERGGEMWCEPAGDRVILRGNAVLTLEGTLQI